MAIRRAQATHARFGPELAVGLVLCLLLPNLLIGALIQPGPIRGGDFIEYWAAGRLNIGGGNPYDPTQMLVLQRESGWIKRDPRMMWNPPHALPLAMLIAGFDYRTGLLLWLELQLMVLIYCSDRLWQHYSGPPRLRWVAWALGVFYVPSLVMLLQAQVGPLMLLGVVGFLHFVRRQRWMLAGACAALLAVKPQLLCLLLLIMLFWIIAGRRWSVLAGGTLAVLACTAVALAFNVRVIGQYVYAITHDPVSQWITPTVGAWLRIAFGWQKFWLQFVPTALAAGWLYLQWRQRKQGWDWDTEIPLVLLAAIVFTPYGWMHDQVLLLVPIIVVFTRTLARRDARLVSSILVPYAALVALTYVTAFAPSEAGAGVALRERSQAWNLWIAPALALWYSWARWRLRDPGTLAGSSEAKRLRLQDQQGE